MKTTQSIEISPSDLYAAITHDRNIATAEGFPLVAARAQAILDQLDAVKLQGIVDAHIVLTVRAPEVSAWKCERCGFTYDVTHQPDLDAFVALHNERHVSL